MSGEVKITKNALYFALLSVGEKDSFLLKYLAPEDVQDVSKYVEARDEWMEKELAELDFDGKVYPSASFMRLLYVVTHKRAVSIWRESGCMNFWINGEPEILKIHIAGEQAHLQLQPKRSFYTDLKGEIYQKKSGFLETKRVLDGKTLKEKVGKTTAMETLGNHVQLMYEEVAND